MALEYLLYHSTALIPDTREAHDFLLRTAVRKNARNDLTGFLHREGRYFLQYLEGPGAAIAATLARIRQDTRHRDLTIIAQGTLPCRQLPDLNMGFLGASQLSLWDIFDGDGDALDFASVPVPEIVDFVLENADSLS